MPTPDENMEAWASKIGPSTHKLVSDDNARATENSTPRVPKINVGTQRSSKTTLKTGNEALAAQAAEALVGLNSAVSMALMVGMMPMSASAIVEREDIFREQAYAALLTDPKLCNKILKMSSTSGLLGLLGAYAMLAVGVAPTIVAEKDNLKNAFGGLRKKAKGDGN